MRPDVIGYLVLGGIAAAIVAAMLYAIFARPSGQNAERHRQEIINGFLRVGGFLFAFALLCFFFATANVAGQLWKPLRLAIAVASFLLFCLLNHQWEKYCEKRIQSYGTEPGTSLWGLGFLVVLVLVLFFLLSDKTPREVLLISIMPPIVMFRYTGWRKEIPWKKLPNTPMAIYFLYCCGVLWYLHAKLFAVFILPCLGLALFFSSRAVRQWQAAKDLRHSSAK